MAIKSPPYRHILEMKVGEVRWTVPWAMTTRDGVYYLNGEYQAHNQPRGDVRMKIIRTIDGFSVTLPTTNKHHIARHCTSNALYFPVLELHESAED